MALDAVGSTNDEAFRLAREGAAEITMVTARSQTGGRGRRGRTWASPPGNLYSSFLLRPDRPAAGLAELSFVAAVAAAEACSGLLPASAGVELKWPNDLLIDGAKLSGILVETEQGPDGRPVVALGIGINVAHAPEGTPYPATALSHHAAVVLEDVASALGAAVARWYGLWLDQGFAPVRAAWSAAAIRPGRPLSVRIGQETIAGGFAGIDESGALLLDLPAGTRRRVLAGDVIFQTG
ncbi:BirA family biotin operon repressor/biotin-[acetyl-CoA-carboxylase] ligase [Stella humosa]|uniref:biotin--[biotin carboxyl-carrier protein] ligase n=1 Tax=Stella humosa TaxID=94 RepID=A0A3N1MG11_9PROT|nr:biotin--[acetyl-CoA-carboxylase] ligase [Stella humosa]ROQ01677.1 BirA family biotin operon repressor/biotin-[acetyl-CoA-carboxylase] ligase [Stella humosa]BBK32059.1 biotin--[acetyl-CoA-carboxylase] ligase [Stella humosa]